MIIREALSQGSADLKFAGIKTPSLDASLLLAHILKMSKTELITEGNKSISEKNCASFCGLIERRCSGECTAYLIGKKEFRGLDFIVNKSVLVPRPDTETLVETALEKYLTKTDTNLHEPKKSGVLDLCTGSGAIAISLKHERPDLEVYAADISNDALKTAKLNSSRILSKNNQIHFYQGDLFNALSSDSSSLINSFSLIISNPPYIPSQEIETLSAEVQNEPRIALDGGEDGLDIIKRIINGASEYLINGGALLLEADPRQMQKIVTILEKKGYKDIQLFNDLSDSQRVIGGKREE
ncbi:MAG: peptide chain release factor N(5)-glutamine methyltransferase [Treponema sp.]|nr:peptide chain release factor N(5)-glutamine methyltransferase [Treponema sp.]MCL2252290.1 peptide chain release factor N(5)-glutamine methyltransferase [Treponema sp.]